MDFDSILSTIFLCGSLRYYMHNIDKRCKKCGKGFEVTYTIFSKGMIAILIIFAVALIMMISSGEEDVVSALGRAVRFIVIIAISWAWGLRRARKKKMFCTECATDGNSHRIPKINNEEEDFDSPFAKIWHNQKTIVILMLVISAFILLMISLSFTSYLKTII